MFTCGGGVAVGGFIPGAKITISVTNSITGVVTTLSATSSEGASLVDFDLPQPLAQGDFVEATQDWNGLLSAPSARATAQDYPEVDLPAPTFDGDEVYACADSLSVRATPGAAITVTHQGVGPTTATPGNGWFLIGVFSPAPWATPWQAGQAFEAEARLECVSGGQPRSWVSPKASLTVTTAPLPLKPPSWEPAQAYAGQAILGLRNVTYGAFSLVDRSSPMPAMSLGRTVPAPDGWGANLDVRLTPLGRVINANERFSAKASLSCPGTSIVVSTPPVRPCSEMPAPEIAAPRVGAQSVIVLQAMPGARIRVFDASDAEIADGQGPVLRLTRPLGVGDVLRVTQTAGQCSNGKAFQIAALGD